MSSIKRMLRARVAIVATLSLGLPALAGAQGFGGGQPPYTPEPDARDLKSVLFNWAWHMGMLRSTEEYDLVMSLVYEGEGTMQIGGQPCNVSMYRSDISYQRSGERIRITGTRPSGQDCSMIEVLSGAYTWNEDVMGAELIPGEGTATPMPATVEERMIRLWAGPQGAWKAAMAGTQYPDAPDMTGRPRELPADVLAIGRTSVTWTNGKPVLTFPIPGVPSAMATATLDDRFMAERVVVENGGDTYDFTYSDYRDWNNPLHPAEAFFAGTMTETKNGNVVRDITTTMTETGQMYVVMPVPASVEAAITPTHQPPEWTLRARAAPAGGGFGGRGGFGATTEAEDAPLAAAAAVSETATTLTGGASPGLGGAGAAAASPRRPGSAARRRARRSGAWADAHRPAGR